MTRKDAVIDIIYTALRALNEELDAERRVALSPHTRLFGPEATLDSLSLVSVIVDVETAVQDKFARPVSLTDDKAMSQEVSPFSDVNALADYILSQLD